MPDETPPAPSGRARPLRGVLAALVCALASGVASLLYLPRASLWNDEATQLSGLTLGPVEVVGWLAGRSHYDFGVPEDRMPPLSYWIGRLWSRAWGLGEVPMRRLGVAGVALAVFLTTLAARRAWGPRAGVAAGLLLALSPNVVSQAVEIRAYPLFLLASAATLACLLRLLEEPARPHPGWLIGMTLGAIAAMYCHFFGLVLAGAVFVAAFGLVLARGGRVGPILGAGAVVGVAALGLLPFVFASVGISGAATSGAGGKLSGVARLVFRLITHPTLMVQPVALGAALVGAVLAGLAALAPRQRSPDAARGLWVAGLVGGAVVVVAHFAQSKFVAAHVSYNVWALPLMALLFASGLAARSPRVRRMAGLGIISMFAADAYGLGLLATRGDCFAHAAYRPIERLLQRLGPGRVAVVHDADAIVAWHLYAPIRYEFGGAVRQYAWDGRNSSDPARGVDYPARREDVDLLTLAADYVLVIRSSQRSTAEIADQIRHGARPLGDGPVARALAGSDRWERVERGLSIAFVAVDYQLFRRAR